jgi:phosphoglycerate dehydrogenase-like enzyme
VKIKVTSVSFSQNKKLESEILKFFPATDLNLKGIRFDSKSLIEYIKDAEGLIIGLEKIDKNIIDCCPNLKIISKYGVGLDNIDLDYCKKLNINIGWTEGINKLSVAEMALGFMLSLCRNLFITSNQLKNGTWNKSGGIQLSNKTVGIIGVGNIGKEVIRLIKPFNCNILVNDIINNSEYYKENNLKEVTKKELFENSDIVTIHAPLTDETKNLINKDILSIMKKTAFLINTSRGLIVSHSDLQWALENNIIAGAALDTYEVEPPDSKELLNHPNLICTPHIGGNSSEAVEAMGLSAINHLVKFFYG